ncbi:MAG: complex I NDUFA9 subunit family protein [Acidobacteriota bacterium]
MEIEEAGTTRNGKPRLVAVFGGTGFLGRRIVEHLLQDGFRVRAISRHPDRAKQIFDLTHAHLESCRADIVDEKTIPAVVEDADGVVNAVSLYVEHGSITFHAVHVESAARLARLCREAEVRRLVQISGIGADPNSDSRYIRARGEGEVAVREAFNGATVIRPAVMFGPDDAFLTTLVQLVRRLPVFPLFGRGKTRLQPVFVEDVAGAITRLLGDSDHVAQVYETGGPRIYTYRTLVEEIAAALSVRRVLIPFPFSAWKVLAAAAERSPWDGLAVNQVELMEVDNVAARPDLTHLGINPTSVEDCLNEILVAE